jgi:hypothetical protein
MKRGDILVIGVIVIVSLAFIIPRWFDRDTSEKNHNEFKTAKITVDGKLFKEVKLTDEEKTVDVETDHGVNILKVHDHGIEMYDADCHDKVCISFGFVERTGGTIVCLPHKLMVEVEGPAEEDGIDATVK